MSHHRVLVTGGSGAIGEAIAVAFARAGNAVAVGYHTGADRARAVADRVATEGGSAAIVRIDQSDPASIAAGIGAVNRDLGGIDILVANAVRWPEPDKDDWDTLVEQLTVNVAGTAAVIEAVLPDMREQHWGRVIVISTDLVVQPMAAPFAYPCAKAAVETIATVLAVREARHGILTNVVRPGLTMTPRLLDTPGFAPAIEAETAATPTGRLCTPEDIAATVTHLGSDANRHVNGAIISISGGRELTR